MEKSRVCRKNEQLLFKHQCQLVYFLKYKIIHVITVETMKQKLEKIKIDYFLTLPDGCARYRVEKIKVYSGGHCYKTF
jgi:hypothetical protein